MKIVSGIDMVSIDRIEKLFKRWDDRFLNRCFTAREQQFCGGSIESLAANFAVKEAFAKATGRGLRGFGWRDVELVKGKLNEPSLVLHNAAKQLVEELGWISTSVSMSHEAGMALAMVVALQSDPVNS